MDPCTDPNGTEHTRAGRGLTSGALETFLWCLVFILGNFKACSAYLRRLSQLASVLSGIWPLFASAPYMGVASSTPTCITTARPPLASPSRNVIPLVFD